MCAGVHGCMCSTDYNFVLHLSYPARSAGGRNRGETATGRDAPLPSLNVGKRQSRYSNGSRNRLPRSRARLVFPLALHLSCTNGPYTRLDLSMPGGAPLATPPRHVYAAGRRCVFLTYLLDFSVAACTLVHHAQTSESAQPSDRRSGPIFLD